MGAELTANWWKKNKAKTLLSEPLTKALEKYDKALHSLNTKIEPNEDQFSTATAALLAVQKAVVATRSKCNPKLHKETLAHLGELSKAAGVAEEQFNKYRVRCNSIYAALGGMIDRYTVAWNAAKANPNKTTFTAFGATAQQIRDHLMGQDRPYPDIGAYFGHYGGTIFRYADLQRGEALEIGDAADKANAGDAAALRKVQAAIRDMDGSVKKMAVEYKNKKIK